MKTFWQALHDESQAIFSDAGVLLVLVGAVLFYGFFYPLPYLPQVLREVPVAVIDQDRSPLSRQLIRMCDANPYLRADTTAGTFAEAEEAVRAGRLGGIVVIPRGFSREIARGDQAAVALYADSAYFLIYRQVMTGMVTVTRTLSAGIEIRRLQAKGKTQRQAMEAQAPLRLTTTPLFNPGEGYADYVVPAIYLLILQQTLLIGIGMVGGASRENPRPPAEGPRPGAPAAILGRATAYLGLYGVHSLYYFGVMFGLFGFPQRGAAAAAMLFLLPFFLAAALLGISIEGCFRQRERAIQILMVTSLPAVFLSGFSWPFEAMPGWLRSAAFLLPSTAGIEGWIRISQMGAPLRDVRSEWLILWGLCGLYFLTAWGLGLRRKRAGTADGRGALQHAAPPEAAGPDAE